ncbi:MAG: SIMPL domain-containing protein [Sphingomonadaceae bacterium]|nr:SIMPL domain-containing protein [Sphingomonadaceae bacterium]
MRILIAVGLLVGGSATAQVPPAELGQRYVPAPWWMREPVIASLGYVRAELPANRAQFGAAFSAVERTAPEATENAARRVAALDQALRQLGADRVRLTTTFATRPLNDQYRDKDGRLIDNQRADKIDRYQVTANVQIEMRGVGALEAAYNRVLAAKPTSVDAVYFQLEPDNETRRELADAAVRDAAARAHAAVAGAGERLGAPKVIDPRGGVCRTEVLAGWPSYVGGQLPTEMVQVSGSRRFAPAPAPPPPPPPPSVQQGPGEAVEPRRVTLQPPRQALTAEACVIYALLP